MFAINPDTNLPISTNFIMTTDGAGGISWIDPIIFGGISLPNLVSTVGGLGTIEYVSTSYLNTALRSTAQGLGTIEYVSTSYLTTALRSTTQGLGTINYVSTSYLNAAFVSTVQNLATAGYISSAALQSTSVTANSALRSTQFILNPANYVSTGALQSTVAALLIHPDYVVQNATFDSALTSTVLGLGKFNYVSTSAFRLSLVSTASGLGTLGYVSTSYLTNYVTNYVTNALAATVTNGNSISLLTLNNTVASNTQGLGTVGYVSTSYLTKYVTGALASTTLGLGTLGYVSSSALESTTTYFLDNSRYVSTGALQSTVTGILLATTTGLTVLALNDALTSTITDIGTRKDNKFVSSISLFSTVAGLGSDGYVSSLSLQSTTKKLTDMILNNTAVSVDRAGNLIIQGGTINVASMTGNIIYLSTFLQSSVTYRGTNGTISATVLPDPNTGTDMMFSTCILPFNAMSSFINEKSRIYVDFFPTLAFTELNTGATGSLFLPMSTFIQYGDTTANATNSNLLPYVNTSWVNANSKTAGFSNSFGQQLKLQIPGSVINGNWASNYILYHYMPAALTFNVTPGLRANTVTVRGSSTNSIFISVQNLP